jgi:hypothetical protein
MKANISIEINDEDRDKLANLMDGKVTKRMVTRKDIVQLCNQHIGGLLQQAHESVIVKTAVAVPERQPVNAQGQHDNRYSRIDPEDQALLTGKDPSYIRGWNQVKRHDNKKS